MRYVKFSDSIEALCVVKKEDVIETIENNIIDKDVALDIVSRCETLCNDLAAVGNWVVIPYIASFKPVGEDFNETLEAYSKSLEEAKYRLTKEEYIAFKVNENVATYRKIKFITNYQYIGALNIKKYPKLYEDYLDLYNDEERALFAMFCISKAEIITEDYFDKYVR